MNVSPVAYLRAAQAYMLISMPTGTSTIVGVFQAIWLSFKSGTNCTLAFKVARNEKFASEIFAGNVSGTCCDANSAWGRRGRPVKPEPDQ